MKSQLSRSERVFQRVFTWPYVALWLSQLIPAWLLLGNPESLWRWLHVSKYLVLVFVGLQLAGLVFVIRRSGIIPVVLALTGGLLLLGFIVFPQEWILLLGVTVSSAGGFFVAWPRIRESVSPDGPIVQGDRQVGQNVTCHN
jgi:FtsH-binding integral membrane protein